MVGGGICYFPRFIERTASAPQFGWWRAIGWWEVRGGSHWIPQNGIDFFPDHLDKSLIPSTFDYSTVHFMLVLTRPLADVSAPKHTAIWPAFIS